VETLDQCLAAGPDAEAAHMRLERLRETAVQLPEDSAGTALLAAVLASGTYLPDLLFADPERLPRLLADPWLHREKPRDRFAREVGTACAGARSQAELQRALRRYARGEMLRLGAREIGAGVGAQAIALPQHGLTLEVARELSFLADACLESAVRFCAAELRAGFGDPVCNDSAPGFSVIAMGKLGGEELNFSSDIDVIYVYASDDGQAGSLSLHEFYARLSKAVTRAISESTGDGFVFRVDLRLRPEGQMGAICNSLAATESYYESFGRTWERQALLRARHAAGDAWLGESFLKTVEPFVYPRVAGAGTLEEVRSLRRMFVPASSEASWDVKLGTGGIRDVELVAQVLQLLYAGKRRDLRERTTLPALSKLELAGLLSDQENRTLTDAYRLLRRIEHRLQLEHGQQTHRLPTDEAGVACLARRLGFSGADEFTAVVEDNRAAVCAIADTLGEPTSGPPATVLRMLAPTTSNEELAAELGAAGFRDLEHSAYSLAIARGRLPPEWLEEAIASPDPDRALALFRDLALRASLGLFALLRDSRQLLRMLASLFGTSERLSRHLIVHAELWPELTRGLGAPTPEAPAWQEDFAARLAGCDYETALRRMRRFQAEEILRIGVHDVAGNLGHEDVSAQLGRLAEACLAESTRRIATDLANRFGSPDSELTILVLGSCGAREMRYGSDLELVFLYERDGTTSTGMDHQEWFARLAQRLIGALGALLEEGRLYTVDTRLRPSGSQGLLVTSYRAFEEYHQERAAPWERVALLRGRVACVLPARQGEDDSPRSDFSQHLDRLAYQHDIPEAVLQGELLRMRKRIEQERAPAGTLHLRFSPGGLTDLEFIAAWGQLRHGDGDLALRTTNPFQALARMVGRGDVDARLLDHYHFLARACLRLRLLRDYADDRLSTKDEQPLARSLGLGQAQLGSELHVRMTEIRAEFLRQLR
jgi:[glutamine synthetase] adenylyltransferase / [glutamine synthetase]-adenylyl-L-tyrosine phosphorylase